MVWVPTAIPRPAARHWLKDAGGPPRLRRLLAGSKAPGQPQGAVLDLHRRSLQ
ncbi:MAG TPA: hypothetical protein VF173_27010 [Thermoanaerobaculia bacterium]|nr:hypothetical protein [Thermoanaerobaculia bacterium]